MQSDELTVGGDGAERAEEMLLAALDRAIERARGWDYDLPSEAALKRARAMIARASEQLSNVDDLEICVAIDGGIEFSLSNDCTYTTVEISPLSARIDLVARDLAKGLISASQSDASEAEAVRQLERAA